MRAFRHFARLSWRERLGLGAALFLVWRIRLSLTVLGYGRTRSGLSAKPSSQTHAPDFVAWSVRQASKFTPGATCLVQALAVQHLLAKSGVDSDLRVGARRGAGDKFEAHAWVIHEGRVIIGGTAEDIETYSPLVDLPAQK